jgi:hypothetical protein
MFIVTSTVQSLPTVLKSDWWSVLILILEKGEVGIYGVHHLKHSIHLVMKEKILTEFNISVSNDIINYLDMRHAYIKHYQIFS